MPRTDGGNANRFLTVEAVGTASNRDGIGGRVCAVAGDLVQTLVEGVGAF